MRITTADYHVDPPSAGLAGYTLPAVFSAAVAAAPEDIAATDGERSWTWRQWQADADALARGLQERGIEPGEVVAARLPNGWEFLTLHLAVASIGAVMVPLPGHDPAAAQTLLERVAPAVVVDPATWRVHLDEWSGHRPGPVQVTPDAPFVLVPSSGAKICIHSHDGLLSNAAAVAASGAAAETDVVVSAAPFTHPFGLQSIHVSLFARGRQVLLPEWDVNRFFGLAAAVGATVLYAAPGQLDDIAGRFGAARNLALREVRTGGAATSPALVEGIRRKLGARLVTQWGTAEVGAGTFTRPGDSDDVVAGTVGSPVSGARVRVVDGELQFRGPSLFRGYLHEPGASGAAMTPDGWFRTGDLAAVDAHGRVVHRGRSAEVAEAPETGQGESASHVARTQEPDDPVVIVGMGCRLPGGIGSPDELWQALIDGRDVRSRFPTDRGWPTDLYDPDPSTPNKSMTDVGGFIDGIADFDHEFFGVKPRDARTMDPQQRLLLEVTWETLEQAGIATEPLRDTDVGVFVGMMPTDYGPRWSESPDSFDGTLLNGIAGHFAAGRLAYFLGLRGPAITIDTACSSSLTALHLAVGAIERGECSSALVGGVTAICTPAGFVEFSRLRAMAPDGRCKAFAADADGVSWSEGAAAIVVERLSEARRLGHRVLAVVRGIAVNQDGASDGLTAPSGPAQQRLIRQALRNAGLTAADVDVVEAHGTGTPLGDLVEAQALSVTYGVARDEPVWLGSVKSNIGHTQAASGLVSVIKMVLAMRQGTLPRTMHVEAPNPHVDWSAGALRLLLEPIPWPDTDRPRRAGVSAFGLSGTNAHVILEQAPPERATPCTEADTAPWVLTARTAPALRATATKLLGAVRRNPQWTTGSVARALATRTSLKHRAVVLRDHQATLEALVNGGESPSLVVGTASAPGPAVFMFSGQGAQWPGMAGELLRESAVFAESIAHCEQELRPYVDWKLSEVLTGAVEQETADVVQPALFAVMVALSRLWQSYGIEPDAVVGHSQGEIAAAHVAGGLSLPDAARIVAVRSKLLRRVPGAMAWLPLNADSEAWGDGLTVAAVNDPRSVVVSGDVAVIEAAVARIPGARRIPADFRGHSAGIAEIRNELLAQLDGIAPRSGSIPYYSTVTGTLVDTGTLTPEYWYLNLREPVAFERTIRALTDGGHRRFVEVGPHPVLTSSVEQIADVVTIASLRSGEGNLCRFERAVADAQTRGFPVKWYLGAGAYATLPTYPFQRKRHWIGDAVEPVRQSAEPVPGDKPVKTDVLATVRSAAAAVTGEPDPLPADASFRSLGYTSLLAVELRNRLERELDRPLPAAIVLDHDTPRSLADHLTAQDHTALPSGFEQIYRRLCSSGASETAAEMIREVSRLRTVFTDPEPRPAVRLASGAAGPVVICFPSVLPLSAPSEYAGFAASFDGRRDVYALSQPGFVEGESLPADRAALAAAHAAAVKNLVADRDYVLCGHSSGGWIAHLVTELFIGKPPAGLVLLDSPWPGNGFVRQDVPLLLTAFIEREKALGVTEVGMTRLSAMGAYLRMMDDWEPAPIAVPVLHVAAADNGAVWHLPHTAVTVTGNHFTMVDSAAEPVARWLDETRSEPRRVLP